MLRHLCSPPRTLIAFLVALGPLALPLLGLAATCDLDGDGDVDRDDLSVILLDRRKSVAESACGAACDIDGDGRITVLDARKCVLQCTLPRCAVVSAPADSDGDGVPDSEDQCPGYDDRIDVDQDGVPDGCDTLIDSDGDGIADADDQCPGEDDTIDVDNDSVPDCIDPLIDSDGDGVADSQDACPGHDDRIDADQDGIPDGCDDFLGYEITGVVVGGGTPLPGADVEIGPNSVGVITGADGSFSARVMPSEWVDDGLGGKVFPVEVKAEGFGTGYAKVPFVAGQDDYTVQVFLIPVSDGIADDDVSDGVSDTIEKAGETVGELSIPTGSLPEGVTSVTGTVTYIDPTDPDQLAAFPGGDFLAAPTDGGEPVLIESLGLLEFALFDQDGNPITELAGPAEVCMRVPEGVPASDGETIPLWYYDPQAGIWKEEGQAVVEDRSSDPNVGELWACGEVTHFTWWNVDRPVQTHACFKFRMVDETTGEPFTDGRVWYAQGVSYSGVSPERPCACDSDDPAPCPVGQVSSFTVKRSADANSPEQIRVYTVIDGTRYYLRDDGDGTYSLVTDAVNGTIFSNPTAQGSCLWGTDVGNCALLDGGDGVLRVGAHNPPPRITDFTVNPEVLYLGEQADLSVTATDEQGIQSIAWEASCGAVSPGTASGDTYPATFTAPDGLPEGVLFSYCLITVKATDTEGATAMAQRTVVVHGELPPCEVSGTVYGPGGQPLAGAVVTLQEDWGGSYESITSTDANGFYAFDDVPCCDPDRDFSFSGMLTVEFEYGGVQWTYEEWVSVPCSGEGAGEGLPIFQGRRLEPSGPAPDGTLAAAVDRLLAGPLAWAFIDSQACGDYDIHLPVLWGTLSVDHTGNGECPPGDETTLQVDPDPFLTMYRGGWLGGKVYPFNAPKAIGVPVAPGAVSTSCVGGGYDEAVYLLQHRDESRAVTIGDGASGTVSGTVYDGAGKPLGGAKVVLSRVVEGEVVPDIETFADSNGQYSFAQVPTGWVTVAHVSGADEVARTSGLLMQPRDGTLKSFKVLDPLANRWKMAVGGGVGELTPPRGA